MGKYAAAADDPGINGDFDTSTAESKSSPESATTKLDRKDMATWVSGPREALGEAGIDLGYRGERLGLPKTGVGAIAGFGKRVIALLIDWIACTLVAQLIFPQDHYGSTQSGLNTMIVFFAIKSLFTWLGGATPGQRITGIRVISVASGIVQPWWALLRTALICLVIPAVVWDRDGRGLQDLICRTIVVRSR